MIARCRVIQVTVEIMAGDTGGWCTACLLPSMLTAPAWIDAHHICVDCGRCGCPTKESP